MKIKGILFDMDGTLLNTLEDLTAAVNAALDGCGWPRRQSEEIREFLGRGARWLVEHAVPAGTDEAGLADCLAKFQAYYMAHNGEKTVAYPGIPELLRELKKRGLRLAVVSNKPDGPVGALAEEYFPGIFDVALGERPGMARKPAPDMPRYAMEQLGLTTSDAVYVGDSEVDVATARGAGLPAVAVSWGFRSEELLRSLEPEYLIHRPEQLLALLDGEGRA